MDLASWGLAVVGLLAVLGLVFARGSMYGR